MAKPPFLLRFDHEATTKRLSAVLDQLAYEPIRPDLPGFESFLYGQGYIWELSRNIQVLAVDATRVLAEEVFGASAKKRPGETIEAHDQRLEALITSRPGAVPLPLTTLEISTALRFLMSPRALSPGPPIRGTTVHKMIGIIRICAMHAADPRSATTRKYHTMLFNELTEATKSPQFREQLVAEKARIAVRTAGKLSLLSSLPASENTP